MAANRDGTAQFAPGGRAAAQAPAGRYQLRKATSSVDLLRARALRALCFHNQTLQAIDAFDHAARHFLIEDCESGLIVCSFRLATFDGAGLKHSYSAQFYDLSALAAFDGPMLELGRFCVHPDWRDPDILRLAWGRLAAEVDAQGGKLLFGCSSFSGVDCSAYRDAFALLNAGHLAPTKWQPRIKSPEVIRFDAQDLADARLGMQSLPPLLRSYLAMGGWVSDHAVVDRAMNTLHVFTGLEIAAIPPGRKRLLRALAEPKRAVGH